MKHLLIALLALVLAVPLPARASRPSSPSHRKSGKTRAGKPLVAKPVKPIVKARAQRPRKAPRSFPKSRPCNAAGDASGPCSTAR